MVPDRSRSSPTPSAWVRSTPGASRSRQLTSKTSRWMPGAGTQDRAAASMLKPLRRRWCQGVGGDAQRAARVQARPRSDRPPHHPHRVYEITDRSSWQSVGDRLPTSFASIVLALAGADYWRLRGPGTTDYGLRPASRSGLSVECWRGSRVTMGVLPSGGVRCRSDERTPVETGERCGRTSEAPGCPGLQEDHPHRADDQDPPRRRRTHRGVTQRSGGAFDRRRRHRRHAHQDRRGTRPAIPGSCRRAELTAAALRDWCRFTGAGSACIDPGSPWQNPWVES